MPLLVTLGGNDARGGQAPGSELALSPAAARMHERLVTLSEGNGSLSELRIELMDGGMSSHRSFELHAGKLVGKEWSTPGAPMVRSEGSVTDSRVSELLLQLIATRYWTFQGTRFVPDAPVFLFRFYYGDLDPVDFRCDAEELQRSESRRVIRDLFLDLVSETEMKTVH